MEGNPLCRREETTADYVDRLDLYIYRISSSDSLRFSIISPTRTSIGFTIVIRFSVGSPIKDIHRIYYSS